MTAGKRLIYILWPSFIVAGIAEGVFFTLFDPMDLRLFDQEIGASRMAVYSIGFFAFWLFAAGSSALTCFFQRTASEINRRRDGGFDASQSARSGRALH
jgi:hypothetical protein